MLTVNELTLNKQRQTLPSHLSVVRQPSANSEYTELPLKEENENLNQSAHTHPPLSYKKSNSLPSLFESSNFPYYANIADISLHMGNQYSSSYIKQKAEISDGVPRIEDQFIYLSINDSDEHYYINHNPRTSLKIYQSLTPDTLEEQTLYSRPG